MPYEPFDGRQVLLAPRKHPVWRTVLHYFADGLRIIVRRKHRGKKGSIEGNREMTAGTRNLKETGTHAYLEVCIAHCRPKCPLPRILIPVSIPIG